MRQQLEEVLTKTSVLCQLLEHHCDETPLSNAGMVLEELANGAEQPDHALVEQLQTTLDAARLTCRQYIHRASARCDQLDGAASGCTDADLATFDTLSSDVDRVIDELMGTCGADSKAIAVSRDIMAFALDRPIEFEDLDQRIAGNTVQLTLSAAWRERLEQAVEDGLNRSLALNWTAPLRAIQELTDRLDSELAAVLLPPQEWLSSPYGECMHFGAMRDVNSEVSYCGKMKRVTPLIALHGTGPVLLAAAGLMMMIGAGLGYVWGGGFVATATLLTPAAIAGLLWAIRVRWLRQQPQMQELALQQVAAHLEPERQRIVAEALVAVEDRLQSELSAVQSEIQDGLRQLQAVFSSRSGEDPQEWEAKRQAAKAWVDDQLAQYKQVLTDLDSLAETVASWDTALGARET